MNNLKRLFWNQYKPADERELTVYLKAYKRSYYSLVVALIVLMTLLRAPSSESITIADNYLLLFLFSLLILSQLFGWTSLRKESLSFTHKERNALSARGALLVLLLALIFLIGTVTGAFS